MNTYSSKFNLIEIDKFREIFKSIGANFTRPNYMIFQARGNGFSASFYESGKYVIQGAKTDELLAKYFNKTELIQKNEVLAFPHIGIDESGKGDFFGPLVIAGALLDEQNAKICTELGVCDSKKLDDRKILKLAVEIKKLCPYDIICVTPKKYNELYENFKNLNKLLAWGHATVLENILTKQPCELALSDQFADESVIIRALKDRGKNIKLVQRTKAEEDIAVACASVLARAEFVNRISRLSSEYELELPKGASPNVVSQGKKFVKQYGESELKNVAKLHFKTKDAVLS